MLVASPVVSSCGSPDGRFGGRRHRRKSQSPSDIDSLDDGETARVSERALQPLALQALCRQPLSCPLQKSGPLRAATFHISRSGFPLTNSLCSMHACSQQEFFEFQQPQFWPHSSSTSRHTYCSRHQRHACPPHSAPSAACLTLVSSSARSQIFIIIDPERSIFTRHVPTTVYPPPAPPLTLARSPQHRPAATSPPTSPAATPPASFIESSLHQKIRRRLRVKYPTACGHNPQNLKIPSKSTQSPPKPQKSNPLTASAEHVPRPIAKRAHAGTPRARAP